MWVLVTGAPGTAKGYACDLLQKEGFLYLQEPPTVEESGFDCELGHIFRRLKVQLQAQQTQSRKDIVTVRSFWDCELYLKTALYTDQLTELQFTQLSGHVKSLAELLTPPAAVIFMRADKMVSYDRVLLKSGVTPHDDEFNKLRELYEDFAARIKIPLVDIDASDRPEDIKESLIFNLSSLRLTRAADSGLWKREMFFE